jgi:hypothetical protein
MSRKSQCNKNSGALERNATKSFPPQDLLSD